MRNLIIIISCLLIFVCKINAQTLPLPDHVIIVMEENYGFSDIYGSFLAPHINALIGQPNVALFDSSFAITHPSQPNYLMLYYGTNNGVTDDYPPPGTPWSLCNLGSSIIQSGKTWGAYSEDLPYIGFTGDTSGDYASKHCPWVNCQGHGINQVPDSTNMPFSSFPYANNYSSLPTISFVIPNLAHDMHNPVFLPFIAIPNGDNWFNTNLDSLINWVKSNNSLLILTFDEDDGGSNQIFTMFIGEMVKSGTYHNHINHYDILRTLEDMYSLPPCGNSASATAITDCWLNTGINEITDNSKLTIYPNPAKEKLNLRIVTDIPDEANLSITDNTGRIVKCDLLNLLPGDNTFSVETKNISAGVYFLHIAGQHFNVSRKFIVQGF